MLAVLAENQAEIPAQQGVSAEPPVPSALQVATWDRVQASPDVTVYLAADPAGGPVGTACLSILPNITYDCRPTAFIEAVVVAYAHRRRGVAALLLEHVLTDSRAAGCHKVQLLSHKRHARDGAHALYASAGFSPEAEGFRLYL